MIISKFPCFYVKTSSWGCFKGVSSLSDLCLAGYWDDLLVNITGLVVFFLVPDSDESPDDVSNESSEDNEDKESEKNQYNYMPYGHVIVPLIAPL